MKERVLNRLTNFVFCELPIEEDTWPSMEDIEILISLSPHYQALLDVGLPRNHEKNTGRETVDQEIRWLVLQRMRKIEQKWINKKIHDCLGMKELEECIVKEIGTMKMGYNDAISFIKEYYTRLQSSISNTLYYSGQVFSEQELEMMVPHVDAPFFNRDWIIKHYLDQMSRTKPQGYRESVAMIEEGSD